MLNGQSEKSPVTYSLTEAAPDGYNAPVYGFCEENSATLYYYVDPDNPAKTIVSENPNLTYVNDSGETVNAVHVTIDDPENPGQTINKTAQGQVVSVYSVINATEAVGTDGKLPAVINQCGMELPATGGPGTRIFTILGSILILGAGVLLWRRRRLI